MVAGGDSRRYCLLWLLFDTQCLAIEVVDEHFLSYFLLTKLTLPPGGPAQTGLPGDPAETGPAGPQAAERGT